VDLPNHDEDQTSETGQPVSADQTTHIDCPPPGQSERPTSHVQPPAPPRRAPHPAPTPAELDASQTPWWREIYQRSPRERHDDQPFNATRVPQPDRKPTPPPPPAPPQPKAPAWYEVPPQRSTPPPVPKPAPSADGRPRDLPPVAPEAAESPLRPSLRHWSKRRRVLIIGAALVVAIEAIALVVVLRFLGASSTKDLDVGQAEAGVAHVLMDPVNGYGANSVSNVRCNDGKNPDAKKGSVFKCQALVNGDQRQITAVIVDDSGTYEIDWPR
jgi:hypothetical protein